MEPEEIEGQAPPPSDTPPPADPTPATQPPPADPATQADPPADPPAQAAEEEEEEIPAELTAAEYETRISSLNRQSARYRTERNTARTQVAELQARVAQLEAQTAAPDPTAAAVARAEAAERRATRLEVATEVGVSTAMLKAMDAVGSSTDADSYRSALTAFSALVAGSQAAPPPQVPNPTPPGGPNTPPSLDEQIAAAEKNGDWQTTIRLKGLKARQSMDKKK